MNFRTTIVLLVLLVLAVGAVTLLKIRAGGDRGRTTSADDKNRTLLTLKSEQVTLVRIRWAGKAESELVLQKDGENWKLAAPVSAAAERFAAGDLVDRILGLQPRPGRVPLDGESAKTTGLDSPRATIELKDKDGKTEVLEVGNRSALGTDLFVRVQGQKDGRMVSAGALGDKFDNIDKLAQSLRKKELVDVASADVRRIEITPMDGPAVVLQRDGADWKMIAPQSLDADTREVGDLVAAVCTLRAEEFLDNSSPLIAGARFDRPLAGVKLWKELPSTQSATQPATLPAPAATILFGQFADIGREKILVKVGDTIAKAAITKESWEKLGEASVLGLRDRKLLDIAEGKIKSIKIETNTLATTRPTTKPAAHDVVTLIRTVTPATRPAPATTQAATEPAPPAVVKWVIEGKPIAPDRAKLDRVLGDLHPLSVKKFIPANPATQPADTVVLTVVTEDKTHAITFTRRPTGGPIGSFNGLIFEAEPELLTNLKADFTIPSPKPPMPPAGMGGMPGMPDEDGH